MLVCWIIINMHYKCAKSEARLRALTFSGLKGKFIVSYLILTFFYPVHW